MRTTKEVLDDHLNLSKKGTIEEDLKRNYSEDIILLTTHGTYKGHQGLKKLMEILIEELPDPSFEYKKLLIEKVKWVFLNGQETQERPKLKMAQILM